MKKIGLLLVLGILALNLFADETVSMKSLLSELSERQSIAQWPANSYRSLAVSSYDRRSERENMMLANWDRSYFLGVEENEGRREYVMLESNQPGAITRFWITYHGPGGGEFYNGTMRVYLDGSDQAEIEGPIQSLISGGILAPYPLSMSVSPKTELSKRGHNLYLPIPWATSCKVTYESPEMDDEGALKGEALYYQINYREYNKSTKVNSFSQKELQKSGDWIEQICGELTKPIHLKDKATQQKHTGLKIAPDDRFSCALQGPKAISRIKLKFDLSQKSNVRKLSQQLRSLQLAIQFDELNTVNVPVGAFFGTGNRLDSNDTRFSRVNKKGELYSSWVMPFQSDCKIQLINNGKTTVAIEQFIIETTPYTFDSNSLYFHSEWNYQGILNSNPSNRPINMDGSHALVYNYITVTGRGRYVGDSLTLYNGGNGWWGEGDDLVYVDGETFPSQFGTGTEDYFGYAWCHPNTFSTPFISQPSGEGNYDRGYTVNSRYRILDDILFDHSLRFDFEFWHWKKCDSELSAAIFWYGEASATSNFQTQTSDYQRPVIFNQLDLKKASKR